MYKGLWKRIDKEATGASVHNLVMFASPVTPSPLEIGCELSIIHLKRTPVWKTNENFPDDPSQHPAR